jgi:two-component system, chemotaxis family, chemotaxis protein CheY
MTKKFKILCVDDSKSIHAFLQECLAPITETIDHVYNGQEAVDKLKSNMSAFDLIILDWEMPVKDGPTTFKELKSLGLNTPVFMLTSKNDPVDILKMIEAGVAEYMMKPFTADIIIEKIQQVLG